MGGASLVTMVGGGAIEGLGFGGVVPVSAPLGFSSALETTRSEVSPTENGFVFEGFGASWGADARRSMSDCSGWFFGGADRSRRGII